MTRASKGIVLALVSCAFLLAGAAGAQEKTTTTEHRTFEIISVDGNHVVVRGPNGVRELTLPADFKIEVNGQQIGVADLKPGMKGTATITTTTTSTPVVVTEVKNGEVLAVQGNTIIVRTANGNRKFTVKDVKDRNITIMKDGAPVELSQLRVGDKLSATIITKHPPVVVSERQLKASVHHVPAEPAPAPAAAAPAEPAPAPAPAEPAKKLPKTGSDLPLLAWFASVCLAAGLGLTVLRRTRKTS